jgi:hypothetical protein
MTTHPLLDGGDVDERHSHLEMIQGTCGMIQGTFGMI